MFLRSLFVLACLSSFLPAQREGEVAPVESELARRKREAIQAAQEGSDVKDSGEKGDPDNALEKMTPEQRLNHGIRHGATGFCRFVAQVKPAKVMPGQAGTLIVTAILQGAAVLPAPAPLEVTSAAQQGLVTLGAPAFRPPGPGKLAPGYLGRPVYDNWAIFEVPLTVGNEARVGQKLRIALDLKFDLFDGVSTQAVGRFTEHVAAEVEVGQVADPSVIVGRHQEAPPAANVAGKLPGDASADAVPASGAAAPGRTVDAAPVVAHAAQPGPAPAAAPVSETAPPSEEESGLPLPPALLIGGGLVILVLVVLLVARR